MRVFLERRRRLLPRHLRGRCCCAQLLLKRGPTALLETPMELIDSIAVDQAADHLVTLLHTQEVKRCLELSGDS